MFKLRPYQEDCVASIRRYVESRETRPGVVIGPVACGKSLLIAEAARLMGDRTLVLQPSKELLLQNIGKLRALGGEATIYSASCGKKELSNMIYATLGSVKKVVGELKRIGIHNVLVDEVHAGYSPEPDGEFMRFMRELAPRKVIGFTATPCRLSSVSLDMDRYSMLRFMTRTRPGYFKKVIHVIQVEEMLREGFWSDLSIERWRFDGSKLTLNTNGSEYTEESVHEAVEANGINNLILRRIMGMEGRKSILVFMDSVENCRVASIWLNAKMGPVSGYIHGGMGKKERDKLVEGFKDGSVRVVFNHSVLLAGFDHPGLDAVIFGRPTFSFPTFYQSIGRGLRIKEGKENCLFVDCCDNTSRFGDIREMSIRDVGGFGWAITIGDRIITNVPMEETVTVRDIPLLKAESRMPLSERRRPGRPDIPEGDNRMPFGMYKGWKLKAVPTEYLRFLVKEKGSTYDNMVNAYVRAIGL